MSDHRIIDRSPDRIAVSRPHEQPTHFFMAPGELVVWIDGRGACSFGRAYGQTIEARIAWVGRSDLDYLATKWRPGGSRGAIVWSEEAARTELLESARDWGVSDADVETILENISIPDCARCALMRAHPDAWEIVGGWGMVPSERLKAAQRWCSIAADLLDREEATDE